MSNSATFEDFYQVPDLSFDINKLRKDLEIILKNSKYQTLGISNFAAIPMNKIPDINSNFCLSPIKIHPKRFFRKM